MLPFEEGRFGLMGLFERLSLPARQILVRATEAAVAMGSREVDGAHLLFGFVELDGAAAAVLSDLLDDQERLTREAQRVTITGGGTTRPMFSEEVALVLAAAHGVAAARGCETVGTGACLVGLVTILPRSVEEVFAAFPIDLPALREAALALDDTDEASSPPSGDAKPWGVAVGATGRLAWTDERDD